jgi:hypothetical protein
VASVVVVVMSGGFRRGGHCSCRTTEATVVDSSDNFIWDGSSGYRIA